MMGDKIGCEGVPSRDRVVPGSCNVPPGEFPATATSINIDAAEIARNLVTSFNEALGRKDSSAIADLFLETKSYWRDHLSQTWQLRTIKDRTGVASYLESNGISLTTIEIDASSKFRSPQVQAIDGWGDVQGIQFYIVFETDMGRGQGVVKMAEDEGVWRIHTLYTLLTELKGHEEPLNKRRVQGVQHGGNHDRKNWREIREAESNFEDTSPTVMIIGAGQGGLTVAARLKMLGISSLIIDTNHRVGDNWRNRYHQLVLHDPVWYDHMPYVPFPPHWPIFTPKDKLADFFESYVQILELNVWTSTALKSTMWDESKQRWTVKVERGMADGSLKERVFHPHHIVQATGHSGKMNFPYIKGMDTFAGRRLCHSSEFPGADVNALSKKAIVVGCCNSGHDIAQDFYEKGYDVTIVQRSTTCVVSSESITNIGLKGLYDEDGPPVEDADLFLWAFPTALFKTQQVNVTRLQNENDRRMLDGLREAGFQTDNGPNDSGLMMKYFQRGGGYYIEVGASQLIIDGKIKVKHGQEIAQILPKGLEFDNGDQLEADEIVFATGYQNMRTQARLIFGDEIADRVGDVWGLNEEGEFRTMWQCSGHPGLWFMGGNLAISRYYSRILALQIKGKEEKMW